jgi:hypothetical protein
VVANCDHLAKLKYLTALSSIIGGQIPTILALELDGEPTKQLPNGSDAEPLPDGD